MRLFEFRQEVLGRAGAEDSDVVQLPDVNTWVNLAIRSIWRIRPWEFTRTTTTSSVAPDAEFVNLPADTATIFKVINTDTDEVVLPKPLRWLQNIYVGADKGEPIYFTDGGLLQVTMTDKPQRRIRVFPKSDKLYNLEITYLKTPTALTADDQYSPLPEDFDEAIVLWVLIRLFRRIGSPEVARETSFEYKNEINQLLARYGVWQEEKFPTVVLREEY